MRLGKLKIMIPDCPHCGYPVMVNGLVHGITCDACHNVVEVSNHTWRKIFEALHRYAISDTPTGQSPVEIRTQNQVVMRVEMDSADNVPCKKCHAPLAVAELDAHSSQAFCHECGQGHALSAIPAGMQSQKSLFTVGGNVSVDSESSPLPSPISMNCPNCAAALKIGHDKQRITRCEYCNGEFLVPDVLWKRLHPVQTAEEWIVAFDAPPPLTAEERSKKEMENAQRAEVQRLKDQIESAHDTYKAVSFIGYFIALFVGIFAFGFPLIFTPLSKTLGEQVCEGEFKVHTSSYSSGGSSGTNYSFTCTDENGKQLDVDYGLYAIGFGLLVSFGLWTLVIPFRYIRMRQSLRSTELELREIDLY